MQGPTKDIMWVRFHFLKNRVGGSENNFFENSFCLTLASNGQYLRGNGRKWRHVVS
jgi:hypothetical protein